MGDENVKQLSGQNKTEFLRHLLCDIRALERMIENGQIESGITRLGAEQEMCLVNDQLRPAMTGVEILNAANESHCTPELALWNLELNLDPLEAGPGCLNGMGSQLRTLLNTVDQTAKAHNSNIVLTGILPTIRKSELSSKFMTPSPRYHAVNNTLRELRGEDFTLSIEGVDEINLRHSSILFEACNTSFQIHLQVDPQEFADKYNWAQVIAGPVLAACVNSPILLGKELWAETRIALFRQSLETRRTGSYVTDRQPRVAFGNHWLESSAAEIFKRDVATYNLIISANMDDETSLEKLDRGETPKLRAMNLHNGTLYKWNRACYGVGNGKAHLRIENRYIPAGPTPIDEMANVAFWIGLMEAMPEKCRGQWDRHFQFQNVRCNFLRAARNGLASEMIWLSDSFDTARLITEQLLPMAEQGLAKLQIPPEESAPYLNVIRNRVASKQTGSDWIVRSLRSLNSRNNITESLLLITKHLAENSLSESPAHEWSVPVESALATIPGRYDRVDSIMITNLITVREDDLLEFASTLMEWNSFHHLPVENEFGEIVGMISTNDVARAVADSDNTKTLFVSDAMTSDIISVSPEMSLEKAEKKQ